MMFSLGSKMRAFLIRRACPAGRSAIWSPALKRQRGAAILIAMLVVTLVATLAAGLQWRQWRLLQQDTAVRTQTQASWLLLGALDWARAVLREDIRSAGSNAILDHLGEPWALALKEVRLSSFLTDKNQADSVPQDVFVSGQITDAQSKINLTNLAKSTTGDVVLTDPTYQSLVRLYDQLQLPITELKGWAKRWQATNDPGLRPTRMEELRWLGMSPASAEKLQNYLTILPKATPLNLNTASAEAIYAMMPTMELSDARELVAKRAFAPFKQLEQISSLLAGNPTLAVDRFSVSSQFFEVQGRLRLGDWITQEFSLLQRDGLNVWTVWRERR